MPYIEPSQRWSVDDLAWAAGFFDGEGHIGIVRQHKLDGSFRKKFTLQLSISQKTREVLDRFCVIVGGTGKVYGPSKTQACPWRYQTNAYASIMYIVEMLWPWLGTVKRNQAIAAMSTFCAQRCIPLPSFSFPVRDPGRLNFIITRMLLDYLPQHPRYTDYNAAVGVLECVKLEMYRRIVSPYENVKCAENGDVY